ncbi:MAG TPA: glycoside hydrolase family 43 protein [Sphingobacteriaceae bacterium]|nr:glycoside hydrolase family 43 protein [Sphingobacteriaceae bacterium]
MIIGKCSYFNAVFISKILVSCICFLLLTSLSFGYNKQKNYIADTLNVTPGLADPCILKHKGKYYLYGTSDNSMEGFKVYVSKDMINWSSAAGVKNGYALHKDDSWGTKSFWAPQVFYYKRKFYMAYAANESIAIAQSDSPLGPFTQRAKKALAAPVKQIDPFVFIDDDGKKYLYHVRVANGGNRIFVAELTDDFSEIKSETLRECINATGETWENKERAAWSVAEGPTIIKNKGLYYLIYSTNHFKSIDYAVGYAVSKSPYGPWDKYASNPILSRTNIGSNGTGHGDFVKDKRGNLVYVFHTHYSDVSIGPRRTGVVKARFSADKTSGIDKLDIQEKSFYYLKIKK